MNQLKNPQASVRQVPVRQEFVRRFDAVRARMFQVQMARMAIRSLLLAALGLALLAGMDYLWELGRTIREVGLVGMLAGVSLLAAVAVVSAVRKSNRPRTALDIEQLFPELGQSVRTAVQFGGRTDEAVAADGARATLVDALEEQVDTETGPLPIEAIVPTGRMKAALAVAVLVCGALGILYVSDSEWNTAAHRALLDDRPYTQLHVTPGTTHVELGKDLAIGIDVVGRATRQVTLFTRKADDPDADWQEQEVTADDLKPSERGRAHYELAMPRIKDPFAYRVGAGKLMSDEFQVGLRYPLRLEKVEVALTPPEYTRAETTTVTDGNLHALEGTNAVFRFELDRAPAQAKFILREPRDRLAPEGEDEVPPQELPVKIDGTLITLQMELTQEKVYSLEAEAPDGMKLPETSFRIRIRKDQPPQVWVEQPSESLEVHTLAEVLMRIRARDDFGLNNAGIVFQVNNEDEHTLLQKDFEAALAEAEKEAAEKEGEGAKRPLPTTQAVLDKLLPLEYFELTQKDSVTYYAFAEDNFPGGSRRTESDLRFIDIRPFKRTYQLADDAPPMPGMGKPLPLLDELISRQRFALNRSMQIARRFASSALSGSPAVDLSAVENLIEFQQKLASSTHDLADALLQREVAGNDLLFKAEDSMLAAIDSLSAGKYDNAVLQERDALRYLIEGRDRVAFAIPKKPRKTQAELAAFQRMQLQKLRRPKNDEEAEEVAARLRQLADQEEMVAMALGGEGEPNDKDEPAPGSGGKGSAKKSSKKSEKPADADKPTDSQKDKPKAEGDKPKPEGKEGADEQDTEPAPGSNGKGSDGKGSDGKGTDGKQADGKDADGKDADGKDSDDKEGGSQGDKPGDAKKPGMSRDEIVQKQADAVAEAADIQKAMDKLTGLSDLAKSRIAEGLKTAERASGSLERGDTKDAADAAGKASDMFRELARNVEGLTAAETSQKLATARNLAEELSQTEREFANAVDKQRQDQQQQSGSGGEKDDGKREKGDGKGEKGDGKPEKGDGKGEKRDGKEGQSGDAGEQRTEKLAARAGRIAEAGKTLDDILKGIGRSNDPADREAVRQVQELMQQAKVGETVKQLEGQPAGVRAGRLREVSEEARDIADRFEGTSLSLEALHRSIVAPRVAQLMEVEREAVELQEKLDRLETQAQITGWHRAADELLAELEKMGIAEEAREKLVEAMKEAGWNDTRVGGNWDWALRSGRYGAPLVYYRSVRNVVADLHNIIQELILGDLAGSQDENIPPQFERLVERYYQVLSTGK